MMSNNGAGTDAGSTAVHDPSARLQYHLDALGGTPDPAAYLDAALSAYAPKSHVHGHSPIKAGTLEALLTTLLMGTEKPLPTAASAALVSLNSWQQVRALQGRVSALQFATRWQTKSTPYAVLPSRGIPEPDQDR